MLRWTDQKLGGVKESGINFMEAYQLLFNLCLMLVSNIKPAPD